MPRYLADVGGGLGWLDIGSYARYGPARRDRLSSAQIASIARTVRRSPEVMMKVLNQGGRDLGSVARHLRYLDRDGELETKREQRD